MDLTISIVNHNNRELLSGCLHSIFENTRTTLFEIYVVDNGSDDHSAERVQQEFPQVHFIRNPTRHGFAANHNQALRKGAGRYLLILNEDTLVKPGTLDEMTKFMDTHSDAGAMGCKLLNPDGTLQRSSNRFPTLAFGLFEILSLNHLWPHNPAAKRNNYSDWDRNSLREVDTVSGACMLVRREAITQVGLLDENFFLYEEEVDWCYRIQKAKWKIYYVPEIEVIHYGGKSTVQVDGKKLNDIYWASFLYYYYKHYGRFVFFIFKALLQLRFSLKRFTYDLRKIFMRA